MAMPCVEATGMSTEESFSLCKEDQINAPKVGSQAHRRDRRIPAPTPPGDTQPHLPLTHLAGKYPGVIECLTPATTPRLSISNTRPFSPDLHSKEIAGRHLHRDPYLLMASRLRDQWPHRVFQLAAT